MDEGGGRRDGSATWFAGGKLNLSHNCVDRHANGARRDKVALLWEGEPGEVRNACLLAFSRGLGVIDTTRAPCCLPRSVKFRHPTKISRFSTRK